jgi:hypothetical protein
VTQEAATVRPLLLRIGDVFASPVRLGDTLRDHPLWGGALVLGAVVAGITAGFLPQQAFETIVNSGAIGSSETSVAPSTILKVMRWGALLGSPLMSVVITLVIGGGSALLFAGILGDEGRFKQHLALAAHANLIVAAGGLLSLGLILVAGDFRAAITVGTFFRPLIPAGYALRVLEQLSPFGLWALLVLAVGVSRFDPDRSWISAGLWLITLRLLLALGFGLIPPPPGLG